MPDEHGVRRELERPWAERASQPVRRDPVRIVLGIVLVLVAVGGLGGALWLNQPGFAGDPNVKLLDDGALAVVALVLLGIAATGVLLTRGRRE